MNFHWAQANKFLLVVVASAVAIDGVLTTLVVHQQHNHSTVNGQIGPETAAPVPPGARVRAPASRVPQLVPAPQAATTALTPASVASAPGIITPPHWANTKTLSHRRVGPRPASPPPPQTNQGSSTRSDNPVKLGAPPEISNPTSSARSDMPVKPGAPPEIP